MSDLVRTSRHDDVLVMAIDHPPVNALSLDVLEALSAALEQAAAGESVRAVVLLGAGRTFIAGADIRMFPRIASGELPPVSFHPYLARIENCPKPVIAAIHGAALGGGLETAMACHYRIALAGAQVGQPEVRLGLIPGAGGTQRLPRLSGLETAMRMCAFGEPVSAAEAREAGILDRVVEGDLLDAALAFAREAPPLRRTRDLTGKLCDAAAADSLAALFKDSCHKRLPGQTAPLAAIDAVAAAASSPFEAGLETERRLFEECLRGKQSKALIHVFFAERATSKLPFAVSKAPEPVRRAAVIGAGTMGTGIAMCFANAGIEALLADASPEHLDRAIERIGRTYESSVKKGKLTPDDAGQRLRLIRAVRGYEGVETADVVVEAVYEELAAKQHVFRELDEVARPGALLATNTSTLDIGEIAAATKRPESVLGLHFFSPANVMKLVEVVRCGATSQEAIAAAMDLAKRLRKTPVLAGNCFGFIGNRMFAPYRVQAVSLVEQGAAPEEVDGAHTGWGFAMGPLAVGDLVGLDVCWLVRQEARRRGIAHTPPASFEDELYKLGRLGQKNGQGWYRYDENRRALPDPEVVALVREYAAAQGIGQRSFTAQAMRERTLLALVNEGARLLDEGIALRPDDIDVVYVHGYGFPAWRGGPMHYAAALGKDRVLDRLSALYDEEGPFWKPAKFWR